MAYQDFSIESAITPNYSRPSVKLQGVANAVRIMKDPSRASEDFIQGAVTSIGAANRHVLYVNSSLEALNDRLRIASKIAYAVNTSKRRGAEGFSDVPMMNPWAYALEGNGKDFFKRVWQAICTACRRVIDAIANFIRWLGTVIAGLDTKKQIEHYKLYLDNKSKIAQATEKLKNKKIKCPTWKIDKNKITETNRKFKVVMMMMLKEMDGKDQGVNLIKKMSTAADEETIVKFFEDAKTAGDLSKQLKEGDVDKFSENIESGIRGIMGITEQSKLSPKEIVSKFAFTNSQNVETHISINML